MIFKIRIRETYIPKGSACGETTTKRAKKYGEFFDITVNNAKCKWYLSFFTTLFHELMHLGFSVLEKTHGIKYTAPSEEAFCEQMEEWLLINFKTLKEQKK